MQRTKRQHTVPQFNLKYFANENGKIQTCFKSDLRIVERQVKNSAFVNNIYTLTKQTNLDPMALEIAFGEIEGRAATAFRALVESGQVTQSEQLAIAFYLASQLKRTTLLHDQHIKLNRAVAIKENVEEFVRINRSRYDRKFGTVEVDRFLDEVKNGKRILSIDPAEMMLRGQRRLRDYVDLIMRMNWNFVRANDISFITSDNPVFVRRRGKPYDQLLVGIERNDLQAELYAPLTPKLFLVANWDRKRLHKNPVSELRVKELNRLTIICSNKQLFASQFKPGVIQLIKEHRGFKLQLPEWNARDVSGTIEGA